MPYAILTTLLWKELEIGANRKAENNHPRLLNSLQKLRIPTPATHVAIFVLAT